MARDERPFKGEERHERMREDHLSQRRGDHRPTNTPTEKLEKPHYRPTEGSVRNPERRGGGRD